MSAFDLLQNNIYALGFFYICWIGVIVQSNIIAKNSLHSRFMIRVFYLAGIVSASVFFFSVTA